MVNLKINGVAVSVAEGTTVLQAARQANVEIPSLCQSDDLVPWASCGLCVVRLEGTGRMIRACSTKAAEGMSVVTHDPEINKARRTVLELILSNHPQKCLSCIRNNNCELQRLAADFDIMELKFEHYLIERPNDDSNGSIVLDRQKCISCGRCVQVCQDVQHVSAIEFQGRGKNAVIGPAALVPLDDSPCIRCGQCAVHCPVGGIYEHGAIEAVLDSLSNPELTCAVQIAPSVRVALAEEFGSMPGAIHTDKIYAALRRIGFDYVFDTNWSADLTIMEEANEFVARFAKNGGALPLFTSCCPAWVDFAEKRFHEILPHLSSAKSPQQMMGAMIKTYWAQKMSLKPDKIFSVSVMPCMAKKYESGRDASMSSSGARDVDAVLTTRELARLIRMHSINFNSLQEDVADSPLGSYSGAGTIFGATGGVMEAALRTAYYVITGSSLPDINFEPARGLKDVKEAKIDIKGSEVRIAVVHQIGNVVPVIKKVLDAKAKGDELPYHFIEVMACRGGCVGGGGQPYGATDRVRRLRATGLYADDEQSAVRCSHQNEEVKQAYSEFLGEPLHGKAHELLHTSYTERPLYK